MSGQLLFMWSTFRDSSIGTKQKYFWKTHETVKSARIFLQNMSHEQLPFTWSTIRDSSMGTKLKYLWKTHGTVKPPDFFHKNMSYEQLPFMWSTLHRYGFCLWRMQRHYIFTIHLSTCHCHKHLSQVAINLQNRFYFPNAVGVAVVFVAIAIWSWSLLYLSIVVLYPQCESFAHSVQCLNISFSYTVPFAFEKTAVFLLHKSWTLRGDNAVIQDSAVTI